MRAYAVLTALLLSAAPSCLLAQESALPAIDVRQLMTAAQIQASGLGKLSEPEISSLNAWVTEFVTKLFTASEGTAAVIESQIDGSFEGWDGETIFKLVNGQIWQQSSYAYHYHYAFMPHVVIYRTTGGYKMKVDNVEQTVFVQRIR